MTPYGLARIWPHVPLAQRRRLIAQLSQMATRHLETIWQAEEPPDEPNDTWQWLGKPQDLAGASRAVGGGVCPAVAPPTAHPAPGVDPAPIRTGRPGPGAWLAPSTGGDALWPGHGALSALQSRLASAARSLCLMWDADWRSRWDL